MDAERSYAKLFTQGTRSKAGPGTKECQAFVKSIDASRRTLTAIVSTEAVDRDNEIILKEAFRESLPGFLKNPVVLAAHMHRLQDGRSPVVGIVKAARIVKDGLLAEIEFHAYTGIAEEYWQLYKNKVQRAFSIGFIPLEHEYRQIEGKTILCHTQIELLEVSCVAIPSNREALSRSAERKRAFIAGKKERERIDRDAQVFAEMTAGIGQYAGKEKYPWLHNMTANEMREAVEFQQKVDLLSDEQLDDYIEGGLEVEVEGDKFELSGTGQSCGDENRFARLFL